MNWWGIRLGLILVAGSFGSGCETYVDNNRAAAGAWSRGDVQGTADQYSTRARKAGKRDAVIWRLEEGSALRASGRFGDSNRAFSQAEHLIDEYEYRAKVSLSGETVALLSNQAQLPYEGRVYDKVMLNCYRGLNFLQLGDDQGARVEFNRVLRRQEDAVALKRKRIERQERAIAGEKSGNSRGRSLTEDGRVQSRIDSVYRFLDKYKARAPYVNPFAIYLRGLYFGTRAKDNSDLETARHAMNQALAMSGGNSFVKADLDRIEAQFSGQKPEAMVYVLFETGRAPRREQKQIDIPLYFVGDGNVPYVGIALPVLVSQFNYVSSLNVDAAGKTVQTRRLADMEAIISREFADELPTITAKTLLSAASKAALAYTVNHAARKKDNEFGLLALVATSIYQAAVNVADTRTWTTLPKEIQLCSLPMPPDRKVKLSGAGLNSEIVVQPGKTVLLYVKSISPQAPLLVTQTTLN